MVITWLSVTGNDLIVTVIFSQWSVTGHWSSNCDQSVSKMLKSVVVSSSQPVVVTPWWRLNGQSVVITQWSPSYDHSIVSHWCLITQWWRSLSHQSVVITQWSVSAQLWSLNGQSLAITQWSVSGDHSVVTHFCSLSDQSLVIDHSYDQSEITQMSVSGNHSMVSQW